MKNIDLICIGVIGLVLLLMWRFAQLHPAMIRNRPSPLPSGLYTNGALSIAESNNIKDRINFQQQPVGNNFS